MDGNAVAGVRVEGQERLSDRVVSSVPWFALGALFDEAPAALADVIARASAMESSPIVTVNLWFDRPRPRRAVHRPARPRDAVGVR